VDFAEPGLDAFVDGQGKDLCFRNNTDSVIDLAVTYQDGTVNVKLQGVNNLGYTIVLQVEVLEQIAPQTLLQQMAEDNVKGHKDGDVIQEGIAGYKVQVMVNALYEETEETNNLFSITSEYASRDEIKVKIDTGDTPGIEDPGVEDPGTDIPLPPPDDGTLPGTEEIIP
jgi:hypothetical protein